MLQQGLWMLMWTRYSLEPLDYFFKQWQTIRGLNLNNTMQKLSKIAVTFSAFFSFVLMLRLNHACVILQCDDGCTRGNLVQV